jgi:hypothetical protein
VSSDYVTVAVLIAVALAIIAISALLVLELSQRSLRRKAVQPKDLIRRDALSDQRSLMQAALDTIESYLSTRSDESEESCRRVVRLLQGAPWLVASPVISDIELAAVEEEGSWTRVWIASVRDNIEFEYPATGPSFSRVVRRNLDTGVSYRYMVPLTDRSLERAQSISSGHSEVEIRFPEHAFWESFSMTVDEVVVYEGKGQRRPTVEAYYLYPGSDPRMWIKADRSSAVNRLQDLQDRWALTRPDESKGQEAL